MIEVLIVDDSSFMKKSLTHILESDRFIKVVGTAADGKEAIQKVKQLHPQVVLLDIEMPVMDGLAALANIMAECPTPILMLSAINKRSAGIAVKSLSHGAVDFMPKPSGVISYDIDKLSNEIIAKVKMAAVVNVSKMDLFLPEESYQRQWPEPLVPKKIVVIGASTGGPRGVPIVLSALPRDIAAAIIVVRGKLAVEMFAEYFNCSKRKSHKSGPGSDCARWIRHNDGSERGCRENTVKQENVSTFGFSLRGLCDGVGR